MTSREFCYWLQGMFELNDPKQLDEKQTDLIKRHLNMVFHHEIDPSYPDAKKLNDLHGGKTPEKIVEVHHHHSSGKDPLIRC